MFTPKFSKFISQVTGAVSTLFEQDDEDAELERRAKFLAELAVLGGLSKKTEPSAPAATTTPDPAPSVPEAQPSPPSGWPWNSDGNHGEQAFRDARRQDQGHPLPPRSVLPLSSGEVRFKVGQRGRIVAKPQDGGFKCTRIVIGGDASAWLVHDIKIGRKSQFEDEGDVPGDVYSVDAVKVDPTYDYCPLATKFLIDVTYLGKKKTPEQIAAEQDKLEAEKALRASGRKGKSKLAKALAEKVEKMAAMMGEDRAFFTAAAQGYTTDDPSFVPPSS